MKKISVILTSYNSALMIEKTIESILNQTGIDTLFTIELIVVDDCSTDTTLTCINKYKLITFSTLENSGGPNKGRNIGLKHATGDYICISDHDDIWHQNKIISSLPHLQKAKIVSSGFTLIDLHENKKLERYTISSEECIFYEMNATFIKLLTKSKNGQNTYLGGLIYSAELKNILFEEHFGMIDYDWGLRLFQNQESIEICKSLYDRIVLKKNLSLNENYRKIDYYYSLLFIEKYSEEFPKEVKRARKKINAIRAKYYYVTSNMKQSRFHFLKSEFNLKNIAYYLSTFIGSNYIIKKFKVFG